MVWPGHVKRRDETEKVRAVAEMKMEGKRPRGRPKLRWKDTVRRNIKRGATRRNGPLTVRDGKVCARPATLHRETAEVRNDHLPCSIDCFCGGSQRKSSHRGVRRFWTKYWAAFLA